VNARVVFGVPPSQEQSVGHRDPRPVALMDGFGLSEGRGETRCVGGAVAWVMERVKSVSRRHTKYFE